MISNMLKIVDDINPEQELEAYINQDGRVFIRIGDLQEEYITLSKNDVVGLILKLQEFAKEME